MEAVPKLPLLSFELKVSPENTHFGPKLKQYIAEAYREDPDSYSNELHQLEGLRSTAVRPTIDQAGLSSMVRYFCQLRSLQSRFPMAKGQPAACSFSWKDLYANMSCSLSDIRFEMACILYNIGALHTQLGASEPRNTADSLKAACTHYQNAAWAFQYLKEQYPQPPGVDVSTEIMRFLQKVCFAQAQECILEKSIQDTKKPSVVGAVATQVLLFYKNALAVLGPSTGTDNIHEIIGTKLYNLWYRHLSFKAGYIGCIVCLYQGMNAEEQQKMGERVAFYQQAVDKLAEARKLAKYVEPVQVTQEAMTFTNDVVEGKRKAAKNENEFIYHEEVPEKDLLMEMKPVCLVKALPINFNDPEVSGPDIFSRLVPICAHEASSMYSEEKAKILRQIVTQAETKNTELTEFMSSLQLDQLEVIDSEQRIPQEIVDRCAAMNAKTEIIQSLVDSMNNLAEIISDVEHSLAECKALIQEETMKEKEYQKAIGPRPPSIVQTELSREYHKYVEAHTRTNESNQVLHKAMTLHIANLKILAQPLDVLHTKIPSINNIEGLDRATMAEMRRVVGKAREMQTQRDMLVQQLREDVNNDDITSQLLARNTEPPEEIFKQELEKHTPKVKIIEQNLAAQENIINKLTSLYASYAESRRLLTDVLRKRDGLINALITSYDTYEELLGKSQKGLEFYKKLSHNVNQLMARLKSTCQVQEEERQQLLAKNTSKPSTPTPSVPAKDLPSTVPAAGPQRAKLKDYLPYMKNRRGMTPQAQIEPIPVEHYYPEAAMCPPSVRPAPVGSEATDPQMQLPDGVVVPQMPQMNPYDRYSTPYMPSDIDPYAAQTSYAYHATNKPYEKPEEMNQINQNYGYTTPYTPSQFASQTPDQNQQIYSNPYYTASQNNPTMVTDSQSDQYQANTNQLNSVPNTGQLNSVQSNINQPVANVANPNQYSYDPYLQNFANPVRDVVSSVYNNQIDLNASFSQMQVATPKSEPTTSYGNDYTHTYFSVQYPQSNTPNLATYSQTNNSNANILASQTPSDFSSINYPYSSDAQYNQSNSSNVAYSTPDPQYFATSSHGNMSQVYPIYTNADSGANSTASMTNVSISSTPQGYAIPETEQNYIDPSFDALDKPIKSHVNREALSSKINYQPNYSMYNATSSVSGQQPSTSQQNNTVTYGYPDQSNLAYSQSYQNHPGYTYNLHTGSYDYNYGSQNSFSNQSSVNPASSSQDPNWQQQGVYTNAGSCDMVQSPSETPQVQDMSGNNQIYYNSPYGYITNANQSNQMVPESQPTSTNYGANMNQSTYMQSGQGHDTSVTYANNQVSSPKEEIPQPNFDQSAYNQNSNYVQQDYQNQVNQAIPSVNIPKVEPPQNIPEQNTSQNVQEHPEEDPIPTPETSEIKVKPDPSLFDLLADIDFSVEQKPLMPEIKVPQISESAIKKPILVPKVEPPKPVIKEEVIERPAKRDLFSDPSLLNKFTQEVKNLQKLTDSLINKTAGGITVLDAKWKTFQDIQNKENMIRSKTIAMQHTSGNIVTEVVPFDDSRLTLKSDPEAYINASYYKRGKRLPTDCLMVSKLACLKETAALNYVSEQDKATLRHRHGFVQLVSLALSYAYHQLVIEFLVSYDFLEAGGICILSSVPSQQLAPWCIPLVISKNPSEDEYEIFWKAVLENKISCITCLLSEIEMQGKSYWPTAKGHTLDCGSVKVILDEVTCNVHWTERKLTVSSGKTVLSVTHYQINVFPAKIVCSPLVLLVDKILSLTYDNRLSNQLCGAWIQCGRGAGRSAILALLTMVVCQVRAGQFDLCDMIDAGITNLCKNRCNVLEDTKYVADAYRTALFYVQGVLCSGTTMFNGEAVSVPTGAAILSPTPPPASTALPAPASATLNKQKFSRESFEEMKQSPGLKSGDMKDPLNFLDPLWSLKKK